MDFNYSEEQQMLADSVRRFVQQDYDFDSRRQVVDGEDFFSRAHWQTFAELGWLMVPFAEEDGGLGGNAVDLLPVMEEFGKGMVVEPFLPCAVLAGGLLAECGSDTQKAELLPALVEGRLQLAFAFAEPQGRFNLADIDCRATRDGDHYRLNGHKSVVLNGGAAEQLVVAARTGGDRCDREGISLFLVDVESEGVTRRRYKNVDGHGAADIWLRDVRVAEAARLGEEGKALPAIEKMIDRATLAVCAEAVGAMDSALEKTLEYTRTRKQFGRPIASFQALQHRMAEMFIECEQARSMLLMAATQLDANGGVAPRAVSAAKSRIGRAARAVGQEAVQLHGGIGVTDELDVAHLFKRLTAVQYLFGSTNFHTARFMH
ncbi:acyl-CoA dehydrogenase family protein [Microbulbifer halophilus]|uniref:Acyl-CoA dehydrogenase family protein n=1 Tax=Microbulbifer halophilus TaxID=453963 RepID=A0ABW5EG60_9GAMM|nr:acyl-CoA dehydrogenase [Microbulbifer halophilus]MCW8128493.1 acyl-CoA dehydrogenase [Microbulbifer halophilus]